MKFQEKAIAEIEDLKIQLRLQTKKFQQKIQDLNEYITVLENEKSKNTKSNKVNKILAEADEALRRYGLKLRKEGEKYAKQKQGKREQA